MPALPLVALFGPTGVGKTEVAVALAELLRADGDDPVAVSADALKLYAGLEILTGAATAADRERLEHRLVGILPITARASAGDYARRAHAEIDALVAQGRRPIVVGGTGLYLRAALADLDLRPPPDPGARERYARRLADEGVRALHADLLARNPQAAAAIARTDAQRVLRALELLDAGFDPLVEPFAVHHEREQLCRHARLGRPEAVLVAVRRAGALLQGLQGAQGAPRIVWIDRGREIGVLRLQARVHRLLAVEREL